MAELSKGGSKAIEPGIRGRRHKEKRTLTEGQEREIQRLIIDKTPDQLKFSLPCGQEKQYRNLSKENAK